MRLTTHRLNHLTADHARFRRRPPLLGWAAGALAAALVLPGAGPSSRPGPVDGVRPTAPTPPAVATAPAVAAWTATLPNGVVAELIGLGEVPPGTAWWLPDGTRAARPQLPTIQGDVNGFLDLPRELAIHFTHLPKDDSSFSWRFMPGQAWAGGELKPTGPGQATAVFKVLAPTAAGATLTVQVGMTSGAWHTVKDLQPNSSEGSLFGGSTITGPSMAVDGGTEVTVTHTLTGAQYRLVAVDQHGAEQTGEKLFTAGARGMTQMSARFAHLTPDQVRGFRLQKRDYVWATFRPAAVQPKPAAGGR